MTETLRWRKASYSGNQGNCVELASEQQTTYLRDTKAREDGHLQMNAQAWQSLRQQLQQHDL